MDLRIVTQPGPTSPSSLRRKLRSSLCILPCFKDHKSHHHQHQHNHSHGSITAPTTPHGCSSSSSHNRDDLGLLRPSDASLSTPKSARSHHHHEFSELKDKCRKAIGRMGRHSGRRHSGDFKYDQLSYALNFDHEDPNEDDDGFPLRNFSARLPHSPLRESAAAASPASSKEITACS